LFILLSELASNTAMAAMGMPVLAAAGQGLGHDPMIFMVVGALASSAAFMLPVGTPPNAIVFGTGYISMREMIRAGALLNLVSIVVCTLAALLLGSRISVRAASARTLTPLVYHLPVDDRVEHLNVGDRRRIDLEQVVREHDEVRDPARLQRAERIFHECRVRVSRGVGAQRLLDRDLLCRD